LTPSEATGYIAAVRCSEPSMLFSEPAFLFTFLPLVLLTLAVVPRSMRNAALLCASLIFYAWGEKLFVLAMLGSIAWNYVGGLVVDRLGHNRRGFVALSIVVAVNLVALATLKYTAFFVENLNAMLSVLGVAPLDVPPVRLPAGISFFTFHVLSYVVDVYRADAKVQKNPLDLALYVALFPQLIAGPILRYHDIAPQLSDRRVTLEGFSEGVVRFVLGLGKKMILANAMAQLTDDIWALPAGQLAPGTAWLGAVAYMLQIYFDFSGYSDMAVGLGLMFGFHFRENFDFPYIARSIREFWRRWHISLSTWFRDYLYIPLGGNRVSVVRQYANLLLVFFLCGLWHGGSWTFVLWGLFHGSFLVLERLPAVERLLTRLPAALQHAYTLIIVLFGWVLFRADTLPAALHFMGAMLGVVASADNAPVATEYLTAEATITLACALVASAPIIPALRRGVAALEEKSAAWRLAQAGGLAGLFLVLAYSTMLMASGAYNPFIYFRF
jgi:alginate O-acetyltransferase complex protein AlgI